MSQDTWNAVDTSITELFVDEDDALRDAVRDSTERGLPQIQVSPPQGKFLHLLARAIGARRILEIGTLGGYSAIWLARALPPDGELICLELNEDFAKVARANLDRAGVGDRTQVVVGPASETIRLLTGPFDLVFIDADKPGYAEYYEASVRLSRPGTVIVADNVVRAGEVIDPDTADENAQGIRWMNDLMAADPRVDATAIQTVGLKGYDGFALAVVG